jgi:hypothetical protein
LNFLEFKEVGSETAAVVYAKTCPFCSVLEDKCDPANLTPAITAEDGEWNCRQHKSIRSQICDFTCADPDQSHKGGRARCFRSVAKKPTSKTGFNLPGTRSITCE